MDLTRQHLAPIFENIVHLLGTQPGQLELFEPWANEQALRLRRAAVHGKPSLSYEAELLRDELNLMIEPILLGGGKRIFPDDGTARPMQLVKSVSAGTGVQVCTYHPAS